MMRPIALPPEAAVLAVGIGIGLAAAAIVAVRRLSPDIWVLINGLIQPR
jgi:hypothetical protein